MGRPRKDAIPLTDEERRLLQRAVKIAMNDGSIFADVEDEQAIEYRTVKLETLLVKLTPIED